MKLGIYLIAMFLVILISFYVFHVKVRRDYRRLKDLSPAATVWEFVVFGLHANLAYTFLDAPWPSIPPIPTNFIQFFFGIAVIVFGLAVTLYSMSSLSFVKTIGQQQTTALHSDGLYRYSRNPQLVAYGLILVGCVVLWPSLYAVGWLAVYGLIADMMAKTEEEHLTRVFGDEYTQYCKDVPRFLKMGKNAKHSKRNH